MNALDLPPGYRFELTEPDAPRLFAPNGAVAAHFGPWWREKDVEDAAREHAERVDLAAGRLERLLEGKGAIGCATGNRPR